MHKDKLRVYVSGGSSRQRFKEGSQAAIASRLKAMNIDVVKSGATDYILVSSEGAEPSDNAMKTFTPGHTQIMSLHKFLKEHKQPIRGILKQGDGQPAKTAANNSEQADINRIIELCSKLSLAQKRKVVLSMIG
jgi:3-dehydroquinate dehydratase